MSLKTPTRHSPTPQPEDNLHAAITAFLLYCRARNLSPNTLTYYKYRLLAFTRYLDKSNPGITPEAITVRHLRAFLLSEQERASPATAIHSRLTLNAFFGFLNRDGFISTDPTEGLESMKRTKPLVDTFTSSQIEALLATCDQGFVGMRDRALILVLLDTGLRVSELCALEISDLDLTEGLLQVHCGKGGKGRIVPFGVAVRTTVLAYMAKRGDLPTPSLFVTCYGEPVTRFRVREMMHERCRVAGITGIRPSPHTLRHSFAVQFLRNGGDCFCLQKMLGHSSLDMTRRYSELSQADVVEKHRQFSPGDKFLELVKPVEKRRRIR